MAPDLILTGAKIWTGLGCPIGDGHPTSIAVTGGRITGIGPESRTTATASDTTTVIDVGGRRVVPGLVDSHLHAVRAGWSYLDELDWTEVRSIGEALDTVRRAASEREPGTWITVLGGWHPAQLAERRMPTKEELDAAAPRHPVFVHPLYGHDDHGVLNAEALNTLGWTGRCADPGGGVLHRSDDGTPDGRLAGLGAYQHINRVALTPGPERSEASTRAFFSRLAALGLTGVIDAGGLGMGPDRYHPIRAVWRAGDLPIRVRLNLGALTPGSEAEEIAAWQSFLDPAVGDDLLSVLGLGEVMHFGCHDWEGMDPFEITDEAYEEFAAMARQAARRGWPMTVHAILDSSIGRILDAIERVDAETPVRDLRWSLCHAECIGPKDLARVRDLGLALALQGRLVHKARVAAERWGEEAVRNGPPLGDIADLGIPFGAGTDGTRSASYNPWRTLRWFVTGRPQDGGPARAERHRLGREAALDAYTRGSAWLSFEEDRRGVLAPGACADLAVLSADYFTVAADDLPAITSDLTVVDGRVVHAAGDLRDVPVQRHDPRPGPRRRTDQ
ncbi:amidohydrolase [Actinomadura sp. SCN-SB]|uniref:amidohydrolase n=1 Tax=Actinomadura sp. SCN-SB TaxID=3373092 RepID=UPI003750BDD8